MSTVTLKYSSSLEDVLAPHKEAVRLELITATVEALDVDPKGVIIDFDPWGEPKPAQAPDILFRAETSTRRRNLLSYWGKKLLSHWEKITTDLEIPTNNLRVAAKPYVIDSEWHELGK